MSLVGLTHVNSVSQLLTETILIPLQIVVREYRLMRGISIYIYIYIDRDISV